MGFNSAFKGLIDMVVKQHTSNDMQGYSSLCIRTVRDWSEAVALTATGDKRKEKEDAMAATKMKENIRSDFIWSSDRPETFTYCLILSEITAKIRHGLQNNY
jgi:hypothetical protein